MNPHSYRLKGRDFVHQGKIEIDVNERAVFLSELKAAFSFTPTPIVSLTVCKTDGIKKCKAGSISLRLFKLKQIEVNNGQKTIDIRPHTRYNIDNLIRKQCYHYCIAK